MSDHVSWKAGGEVAQAYYPMDEADLGEFLRNLPGDEPVLWVGLGSNLLVRDGGFAGTAIFTHGILDDLFLKDGQVHVGAGVSCPRLARWAARQNLCGLEFMVGIPGTLGGALAMNAGCHGGETWDRVRSVRTMNRAGQVVERDRSRYDVSYRSVRLREAVPESEDELFLGACFELSDGDGAVARQRMGAWLAHRQATQPLHFPNAGSVFRNPPGDHAGRLIEAAGLKGLRIGGAEISTKHANFITNPERKASAADIEALILRVRKTVMEKFGVCLETEVRIVGAAEGRQEGGLSECVEQKVGDNRDD